MDEGKRQKQPRRSFTDEFKVSTVRLVLDEGKSVSRVARDLDLTASAVQRWVDQARADRSGGKTGLTSEERSAQKDEGPAPQECSEGTGPLRWLRGHANAGS